MYCFASPHALLCSVLCAPYSVLRAPCYAMLCYAMLRYAMLCYAMLCLCLCLCNAMLCWAVLCATLMFDSPREA